MTANRTTREKPERTPTTSRGLLSKFSGSLEEWRMAIVLIGPDSEGRYEIEGFPEWKAIAAGKYTLEVRGIRGLCEVADTADGPKLLAPWVADDAGYRGFDSRPWTEWESLMSSDADDMDGLTLADGQTKITFADLRSVRAEYPRGPLAGTSEMTITRRRRLVVLHKDNHTAMVHIEVGQPLVMRGPREYHAKLQVDNIAAIESAVDESRERFGHTVWWRGQGDIEWNLVPSAHRDDQTKEENWFLSHFIQGFLARTNASNDTGQTGDVMMLAQHHRLPTRLFDWSASALVALFFAVEEDNGREGVLWALSPFDLNEVNMKERYIPAMGDKRVKNLVSDSATPRYVRGRPKESIAVHALERYPRMVAQLSRFTIHGAFARPLDVHPQAGRYLRRYIVPASSKSAIRRKLWLLGIRRSILFPDLDNLARDLRETDLTGLTTEDHRQRIANATALAQSQNWVYQNPFEDGTSE